MIFFGKSHPDKADLRPQEPPILAGELPELPHEEAQKNAHRDPAMAEIKNLVEKNIKWAQVLYAQNRRLSRRLTIMALGSYIRLALFLTPIVLALIFLPPYVRKIADTYRQFFPTAPADPAGAPWSGQANLLDQAQRFINQYGGQGQTKAQ